jgi:hypothetical protein
MIDHNEEFAKPDETTYRTTDVKVFNERTPTKSRGDTTPNRPASVSRRRRRNDRKPGVLNVNLNVNNKRRNRNRQFRRRINQNNIQRMGGRPVTLFQRLQLLFSRPNRRFSPLLSRMFNPLNVNNYQPPYQRRRNNFQNNFQNNFPNVY